MLSSFLFNVLPPFFNSYLIVYFLYFQLEKIINVYYNGYPNYKRGRDNGVKIKLTPKSFKRMFSHCSFINLDLFVQSKLFHVKIFKEGVILYDIIRVVP